MNKQITISEPMLPPVEDYIDLIKSLWDSKWLTNDGRLVRSLEDEISSRFAKKYTSLYVNGHLALETCLRGMGLTGEVITTAYSFVSTAHAIANVGLTPVFVDIEKDSANIDADQIEAFITPETSAILAVHVYGIPCDVDAIRNIAKRHGLKVIYDAAHSFSTKLNTLDISAYGDVSMFSMHATKIMHSMEGGILATNSKEYDKKFRLLRNFGITGPDGVDCIGANAKMNEMQAAMGLLNLLHIDQEIEARREVHGKYSERLEKIQEIMLPSIPEGVEYNYAYYPIVIKHNQKGLTNMDIESCLAEKGVLTRRYFSLSLPELDCYKKYNRGNCVNSKKLADSVLCLPIHGRMSDADICRVVDVIESVF